VLKTQICVTRPQCVKGSKPVMPKPAITDDPHPVLTTTNMQDLAYSAYHHFILLSPTPPGQTRFLRPSLAKICTYSWSVTLKSYQLVEITNKMQPCNRMYYSNVYWRLNMFRAAHRSSSGALKCICSLWFIYARGDRPLSRLSGKFPTQP